jgi:hypothetical protein
MLLIFFLIVYDITYCYFINFITVNAFGKGSNVPCKIVILISFIKTQAIYYLIKKVKLYLLTNTITFLELQYEYRLSPTIRRRYLSNYRMLNTFVPRKNNTYL